MPFQIFSRPERQKLCYSFVLFSEATAVEAGPASAAFTASITLPETGAVLLTALGPIAATSTSFNCSRMVGRFFLGPAEFVNMIWLWRLLFNFALEVIGIGLVFEEIDEGIGLDGDVLLSDELIE